MIRSTAQIAYSLVVATVIAGGALAQTSFPDEATDAELEKLENGYANALTEARRSIADEYLKALKNLQESLVKRNQLEQALLVKAERERITELLERPPELDSPTSGTHPAKSTKLELHLGRCSGGVLYDEKRASIRNWTAAGGRVVWDLDADMPAARYEVIATYRAGRDAGGTFELRTAKDAVLPGRVTSTQDSNWDDDKQQLVGTIAIDPDSQTLTVSATSLQQPYLWALRGISLEPVGTWEKRSSSAPASKAAPPNRKPAP